MRAFAWKKIIFISLISLSLLIVVFLSFYLYILNRFDGRIHPGFYLSGNDLKGKTMAEAETLFAGKSDELLAQPFKFSYETTTAEINPLGSAFEISNPILSFDPNSMSLVAYSYGRSGNFVKDVKDIVWGFFNKRELPYLYNLEEDLLLLELQKHFSVYENLAQDASLKISFKDKEEKDFSLEIIPEKSGQALAYNKAIESLKQDLERGEIKEIFLEKFTQEPSLYQNEIPDLKTKAEELLALAPITLSYQATSSQPALKWELKKSDLATSSALVRLEDGSISLALLPEKLALVLEEKVAPKVNKEPAKARFEMKSGRVVNFQSSADGRKMDSLKNAENIIKLITKENKKEIEIMVDLIKDESVKEINSYGIKDLIGTGHSNFAGSPANRRHNIKTGAAAVNGLLIAPEEEFSLVKTLGEIDAKSGYLPELVIKENKTIPEYGGGLCQVGTTVFRAALYSGLPITARRNHSYRVSYYEPAGMDAAVYIPQPDVRFKNDTGNYILIQTRIEGDDIYFDFWGTKDGRQVEVTKPVIYNIKKPAPTKIVETTEIPAGTKKCTEKAHNGADAYFDYKVTYQPGSAEERVEEKRFTSHYVPWQEVCLVGVSQVASSTSATATSSTPQ